MYRIRWMNINWLQAQRKPHEQPFSLKLFSCKNLHTWVKLHSQHQKLFHLHSLFLTWNGLLQHMLLFYLFCWANTSCNRLDNLFFHYANLMYSRAFATKKRKIIKLYLKQAVCEIANLCLTKAHTLKYIESKIINESEDI